MDFLLSMLVYLRTKSMYIVICSLDALLAKHGKAVPLNENRLESLVRRKTSPFFTDQIKRTLETLKAIMMEFYKLLFILIAKKLPLKVLFPTNMNIQGLQWQTCFSNLKQKQVLSQKFQNHTLKQKILGVK